MTRLIRGVLDFQRRVFGRKQSLFKRLAQGQQPQALFITCSDSRINPNLLTQTEPGELFILRNAGNLIPPFGGPPNAEAATVEYAVAHLKVHEVVICGHSHCGAMQGLLNPAALHGLPGVASWLEYAREVLPAVQAAGADLSAEARLNHTIERNVLVQMEHLKTHPAVAAALAARSLRLHGWVYHLDTGEVTAYDPVSDRFVPLLEAVRRQSWLSPSSSRQADAPSASWVSM